MSLFFDIVLLLAAVITIISCTKWGFIRSVMCLASVAIAIVVSYNFYKPVAEWFSDKIIRSAVTSSITEKLKDMAQTSSEGFNLASLFENMPEQFTEILERFGAGREGLEAAYGKIINGSAATVNELAENITSSAVEMISSVLGFLALFVICLIALRILTFIIDSIFKLPVLRFANRLLGFLFGAVCAVILVAILSELSVVFITWMSVVKPDVFSLEIIDSSYILKYISEHNLFKEILSLMPIT